MTRTEFVRQLLTDLGPALDLEGVSEFDDRTWAVVRDEDTTVIAELDETGEHVTLTCALGRPDAELLRSTYETALVANFAAHGPTAVVLSLTGRAGILQISQSFPVGNLTLTALTPIATAFFQKIDQWRTVLATGGVVSAGEVAEEYDAPGGLRV